MATTIEFIEFVCEQLNGIGIIRYKKMFGEYMIYINEKPVLIVCDNMVFVKMLPKIQEHMQQAEVGIPYMGAKEHYILDIDNKELSRKIVSILEVITPIPKSRTKRK